MSEPRDMDAPVTRREMRDAFDLWGSALIDKMDAMVASAERRLLAAMSMLEVRLTSAMHDVEARLTTELGRATKGSEEELTSRVKGIDDQYRDLPSRVARLEARVFAPKRRRRSTSR